MTPFHATRAEIKAAREWVGECMWADINTDEDIDEMTDDEIVAGVDQHYDGGWRQFRSDTV